MKGKTLNTVLMIAAGVATGVFVLNRFVDGGITQFGVQKK